MKGHISKTNGLYFFLHEVPFIQGFQGTILFVVCSISVCSSLISVLYFKSKFQLLNSFAYFKTSCSVFCHLEAVGISLKSLFYCSSHRLFSS